MMLIIMVYLLYMYALYGQLHSSGEGFHGSKPKVLLCAPQGGE